MTDVKHRLKVLEEGAGKLILDKYKGLTNMPGDEEIMKHLKEEEIRLYESGYHDGNTEMEKHFIEPDGIGPEYG